MGQTRATRTSSAEGQDPEDGARWARRPRTLPGPMSTPAPNLRFHRHVPADDPWIGSRNGLGPRDATRFSGTGLADAFARALCARSAVPVKELFEATETFALSRKALRGPVVADLCCGHGLGGALFALMEREVERVVLVDRTRPPSADVVLDALDEVAPWARPKIEWRTTTLKRLELPPGAGVLAIHACGLRTDAALEHALASGGAFAALPCCRPHGTHPAPLGLKNALGPDVAIDVHRTYALEARGYRVAWREIARTITPMNRLLVARRPEGA